MKLKTSIARYIRRCTSAVALTLATGSFALATEPTVIEYLTHDGVTTEHIMQMENYSMNLDASMPETPGVTVWGTEIGTTSIIDAVNNGEATMKGWCPWRQNWKPNYNYHVFIHQHDPNVPFTYADTTNHVMKVSNALRPVIQKELPSVKKISYFAGRSLLPAKEDSTNFVYFKEDAPAKFYYKDRWGEWQEGDSSSFKPIYDENGKPLMRDGKQLYAAHETATAIYHSKDENDPVQTACSDVYVSSSGDIVSYEGNQRVQFVSEYTREDGTVYTAEPIDIRGTKLIIDHSGFTLALGAYSQYGQVEDNLTYIQDVRVTDDIYAASTYRGDCNNNTLIVIRSQALGLNITQADKDAGMDVAPYNNGGKAYAVFVGNSIPTNKAEGNKTLIYGSSTYQEVGGAYIGGDTINNELYIICSQIATGLQDVDPVIGGESRQYGLSKGNLVVIDDTLNPDSIGIPEEDESYYEGSTVQKTAEVPLVTTIHEDVVGGRSQRGYGDLGALQNKVIIKGNTVYDEKKDAYVTTTVQGNVFGGSAANKAISGTIPEPTKSAASAEGNIVSISNANIERNVVVPILLSDKTTWGTRHLSVNVGKIVGGYAGAPSDGRAPGNANNNEVYLTNVTTQNDVFGGANMGAGEASNNVLHLNNISTSDGDYFYGGWIDSYADGAKANNNHVYLYKTDWNDMAQAFLHGGWGNEVKLNSDNLILGSDGNVLVAGAKSFDGTYFYGDDKETPIAMAKGSNLCKPNGTPVYSERISGFDGTNFYDAEGNYYKASPYARYTIEDDGTVLFYNANETQPVATLTKASIVALDSDGNELNTIKETDANLIIRDKSGNVELVQQNNINSLFAKIDGKNEYQTYTKGNWLHFAGFQGNIKGFDHFEKLSFIITKDIDRSKSMVTITGDLEDTPLTYVNEDNKVTSLSIHVDISQVADELKPGDIIPLIGHESKNEIDGMAQVPAEIVDDNKKHRIGVTRTVQLDTEFKEWTGGDFDNFGVIEVLGRSEEVTPESKSLIEGRIAMLTLNNLGGNLVAEQGINSACRVLSDTATANTYAPVAQDAKGSPIYAPKGSINPGNRLFFAMNGAHTKVDSGSNVDVDGTNAIVGVSRAFLQKQALTLGIFMETGWGKYHTSNNFGIGANTPHVRGTGETTYVGAGALLRYRLENISRKLEGYSVDASLRAGRQELDYSSADLWDDYGTFASYEHESDYIAGHVGINYTFEPTDKLTATLYARYLWTHISNDEGDVCGENVTFDDMSSNRLRFGGRLSWKATENWTPYLGAAYEWECSGTAHAVTHGMGMTSPSMRGGSVIGEVGTVWQPNVNRPLWLEFSVQGSAGKNEGYAGKLGVSIGF